MESIVWLLRNQKEPDAKFKSFSERLSHASCAITWLGAENAAPSGDWLRENIPTDAGYVFISDSDLGWVGKVSDGLRAIPDRSPLVVCWIYETIGKSQLSSLVTTQIDEVLSIEGPTKEIELRLKIRSCHAEQRAALKHQIRDLIVRDARNETTLKQREEFLSVCAHDLRSPLGLVQASLSMVLNGNNSFDDLQKELIQRAKRQSEQGIRLVNDLLDVMSYEQGLKPDYQLIDLGEFLTELHKDYSFQAQQKRITLEYENPLKGWKVLADPDRIRQLLQNLVINAIKFTDLAKQCISM